MALYVDARELTVYRYPDIVIKEPSGMVFRTRESSTYWVGGSLDDTKVHGHVAINAKALAENGVYRIYDAEYDWELKFAQPVRSVGTVIGRL